MIDKKRRRLLGWVGFFAGLFATASFVPQIILVWDMRPEPATAISLPMYVVFCIGVSLWLTYGVLFKSWPIIFWNAVTLLLSLTILIYKLIYG
jgi:MtN3 and saliva related transmembrane protein